MWFLVCILILSNITTIILGYVLFDFCKRGNEYET